MIITSRGYMQTRSLEVGLGAMMLVSGLIFVTPGETLANPVFQQMRGWMQHLAMTERQGGMILIAAAMFRWFALYRNSYMRSSPLVRAVGCIIGAAFWFTAVSSIFHAAVVLPAWPWILGMTAVLGAGEIYSAIRTGFDADALDSLGLRTRAFRQRERARREVRS